MDSKSVKKNMFMIWVVASLLWVPFASYMFRLDHIAYAYERYDKTSEKVLRGRKKEPYRWEYYKRAHARAALELNKANRDLGMFFLIGLGFPGIMLAVGTMLLENADKPRTTKTRKKA